MWIIVGKACLSVAWVFVATWLVGTILELGSVGTEMCENDEWWDDDDEWEE